jgi:hypothetical protein
METSPFVIVDGAPADADTEFVYQLLALTTFDRFAVPNVTELPARVRPLRKPWKCINKREIKDDDWHETDSTPTR